MSVETETSGGLPSIARSGASVMPLAARTGAPSTDSRNQENALRPAFWLAMRNASMAGIKA